MRRAVTTAILAILAAAPMLARAAPAADQGRAASEAELSRKASDFGHIVKQRDAQVERRAEVQRIINFADAATMRINRFFDQLPAVDFAGELDRRVRAEASRPDLAGTAAPSGAPQGRRGPRAAERGDVRLAAAEDPPRWRTAQRYPALPEPIERAVADFGGFDSRGLFADLRASLSELRRNLSQNHLYWAANFEARMAEWERLLRKASGAGAVQVLRDLRSASYETGNGREPAAPDAKAVPDPGAEYREKLRRAAAILEDRPTYAQVQQKILADMDQFSNDIKKVGKDYDTDMEAVQRNIVSKAEDLFGSDINSNIFRWLLAVFAAIFVMIMVVPRYYKDSSIAENILKAEFLLQFSTVFILTSAIIILGIGRFIASDQLPVLLAGISGYVLGQLGKPGADIVKNVPALAQAATSPRSQPGNNNPPADKAA